MPKISLFLAILLPISSLSIRCFYKDAPNKLFADKLSFKNHNESVFKENLEFIKRHNSKHDTFELGTNKFSHLTNKEFVNKYCGTVVPKRDGKMTVVPTAAATPLNNYTLDNLPESFSWQEYASPARNQGDFCGACWAFATMGLIEMHNRIRSKQWNNILSTQYLLDCDDSSQQCSGGWPTKALNYLTESSQNQAPKEKDYPYTGEDDTACINDVQKESLNIKGIFEEELNADESSLRLILANNGPVVITINVSEKSNLFKHYKSGIFYDSECETSDNDCKTINHSMLAVGYGVSKRGHKYFLVQNSWGTGWGENGFIRMAMDKGNNCNVACYAIYVA